MVTEAEATVTWAGRCFDGRSTAARPVRVSVAGGELMLNDASGGPSDAAPFARWRLAGAGIGERYVGAPRVIDGPPAGTTLHVDDLDGDFDAALRAAGWRPGRVARWQASGPGVLVATLLLVALVAWLDRAGIGWIAQAATPLLPRSVDDDLDRRARVWLHGRELAPTELPLERRDALRERFDGMARRIDPGREYRLWFARHREQPDFVNAFALPGGSIYAFDGLVERLDDDEVIAVLAHEIAHVQRRHALQGLLRNVGLLTVSSVVLGDASGAAATASAGFHALSHGRDAEREADAQARQTLAALGLRPDALARAFVKLAASQAGKEGLPAYLSTHPPLEERSRAAADAGAPQAGAKR